MPKVAETQAESQFDPKVLIGYPVQFIVGKNDEAYAPVGTVLAAQIVRLHEDGNAQVNVQFPNGANSRTHVPVEGTEVWSDDPEVDANGVQTNPDAKRVSVSVWRFLPPLPAV